MDLICAGVPCQDWSVAGKRAGISGSRSGLFFEFIRVIKDMREASHGRFPTVALFENVPGLYSAAGGRDFAAVLNALAQCGAVDIEWRTIDSQHWVPQRRRRVFIVARFPSEPVGHRGGPVPPAILFEPASGARHPAPGRKAGARTAASLMSGAHGAGVSHPLTGTMFKGHDDDTDTVLVTGPLGDGNDGIGRRSEDDPNLALVATLNSGGNSGEFRTEPGEHLILFDTTQITSKGNYSQPKPGDPCHPLAAGAHPPAIAHTLQAEGASEDGTGRGVPMVISGRDRGDDGRGYERELHISELPALDTVKVDRVAYGSTVRRLTPTECERLQDFPDGHTCLCGAAHEWRTALRVVYEGALTQGLSLGETRELLSLASPEILRCLVREEIESQPRWLQAGVGTEAGAAILHAHGLRPMWFDFGPDPTPQRREHAEQLARELGSPLPILPYEGALGTGHLCEPGRCVVGESQASHLWEIRQLEGLTMTCRCPDSARYRAMGNAVTVPVIEWLGRRLLAACAGYRAAV